MVDQWFHGDRWQVCEIPKASSGIGFGRRLLQSKAKPRALAVRIDPIRLPARPTAWMRRKLKIMRHPCNAGLFSELALNASRIVAEAIAPTYLVSASVDHKFDLFAPSLRGTGGNRFLLGRMVRFGISCAFANDIPAVSVWLDVEIAVHCSFKRQVSEVVDRCLLASWK